MMASMDSFHRNLSIPIINKKQQDLARFFADPEEETRARSSDSDDDQGINLDSAKSSPQETAGFKRYGALRGKKSFLKTKLHVAPAPQVRITRRRCSTPNAAQSSNFFTVVFGDGPEDTELIQARAGQNLKDALTYAFVKRKLSFDSSDLYLERSTTPLPQNAPTEHLKGITINVKKREDFKVKLQRDNSQNSKIEKKGSTAGDRLDRLKEQLSLYTSQGLPQISGPKLSVFPQSSLDPKLLKLENSWECLIDNARNLTKLQVQQQAAIWELLQTEVNYIRQLNLLIDVYAAVLIELKHCPDRFLADLNDAHVFGNIGEVYAANCRFWKTCLSVPLAETRETGLPMDPSFLKDGFSQIQEIFAPYATFCQKYNCIISFVQTKERENPIFAAYLQWANSQNSLNREGLAGVLCQPFQRIMKYGLILNGIKKCTTDPQQLLDLEDMIQAVHNFVDQINSNMSEHALKDKLAVLESRFEAYETFELPSDDYERFVEANHTTLRLDQPMSHRWGARDIVLQGSLKFREGQSKWIDVTCFLFTDMFLICKPSKKNSDGLKVFKPPIRIDKFVIKKQSDNLFVAIILSDFQCASAFYVFTADSKRVEEWLEKCRETRKQYINELCGGQPTPQLPNNFSASTTLLRRQTQSTSTPPLPTTPVTRIKSCTRSVPSSPTVTDRRLRSSLFSPGPNPETSLTPKSSPAPERRSLDQISVQEEEEEEPQSGSESERQRQSTPSSDSPKRITRNRRYRTVDAVRPTTTPSADREIRKRLSLNYPSSSHPSSPPPPPNNNYSTSMESFQSSSGISSAPSRSRSDVSDVNYPLHELQETDSTASTLASVNQEVAEYNEEHSPEKLTTTPPSPVIYEQGEEASPTNENLQTSSITDLDSGTQNDSSSTGGETSENSGDPIPPGSPDVSSRDFKMMMLLSSNPDLATE